MCQIRNLLKRHARLRVSPDYVADDASLFEAGLDSAAIISMMLAIEDDYGIRLPESLVIQQAFSSVAALRSTVEGLRPVAA